MNNGLGMIIESLVAVLLMLTVGYCMLLNRRLKMLKADEGSLRATISELVAATEKAERAIVGLKAAVHDTDFGLSERLGRAETVTGELDRRLIAGKDVLHRLSQIVNAGRGLPDRTVPSADAKSVADAARAFAEKMRTRGNGLAA